MKLVFVCSGKGGTGKSCVAAYTGAALAKSGKNTLLIDASPAPGALDLILGAHNDVVYNLADVLGGGCDARKAVISTSYKHLSLLPAGQYGDYPPTGASELPAIIKDLRHEYDFILIDCPDPAVFAAHDATILLVTTPDTLSARANARIARELFAAGITALRLVINRVPPRVLPIMGARDFDDLVDQVGAQLIAVVPASEKLQFSANNAKPLGGESLTVRVFENLASRLRGKPEPLLIR